MKTYLKLLNLLLSLTFFYLLSSCSPTKTRDNPLDPLGPSYGSNMTINSNLKINFVVPLLNLDANDKNSPTIIYLSWFNATTGAPLSNFNLYGSVNSASIPTLPLISNIPGIVSLTNYPPLGAGTNTFWIEAVGLYGQKAQAYKSFYLSSGIGFDANSGGNSGSPSLRCLNVPLGKSFEVVFTNGTYSAGGGGTINALSGYYKVLTGSTGLVINISLSNYNNSSTANANFITSTSLSITSGSEPTSFTFFNNAASGIPNSIGPNWTWRVSISNATDSDGLNGVWLDDLFAPGALGTSNSLPVSFSPNPSLSGDTEK